MRQVTGIVAGSMLGLAGAALAQSADPPAAANSAIVGAWRQVGVRCVGEPVPLIGFETIGEFRLRRDLGFSVTWKPFERYEDYWGRYTFDPATGALAMTATGGNKMHPEADLNGTARIEPDGRLRLDGISFGHEPDKPASDCAILFERS